MYQSRDREQKVVRTCTTSTLPPLPSPVRRDEMKFRFPFREGMKFCNIGQNIFSPKFSEHSILAKIFNHLPLPVFGNNFCEKEETANIFCCCAHFSSLTHVLAKNFRYFHKQFSRNAKTKFVSLNPTQLMVGWMFTYNHVRCLAQRPLSATTN